MIAIADQLFLVAHDEYNGRTRVHEDMLGLALGAALMVELMFPPEQIQLVGGSVLLVSHHSPPPVEPLQHRAINLMRRERRPQSIANWLKVLGFDARDQVAGRLADAGLVIKDNERRILRSPVVVYRATSPEWAAYAATRLHRALHEEPMYTVDAMLAALVACVGLLGHVTFACNQPHPSGELLAARLPQPLLSLLNHTRAAIAESALSPL